MERWLESLFCHRNIEELKAVLAMQKHIGEVHARADIPLNLVARGMRLLKREIITRLLDTGLTRDELIDAVLRTDRLIDIAFEEMSAAFIDSHESDVRVDEAYRMFAVGHNLALEREKQIGALLEWENRLFRAVATEMPFDDISTLNNSTFGLWLHHKAPLIFDMTRELTMIDDCMRRIDDSFFPQFAFSHNKTRQGDEFRVLVKSVMSEMEQLKYLLSAMFERLTDLEIGRDVLTQLFNRRFLQTILKREIDLFRRKGTQFCVLMLDIDFFKRVNDQYGHDAGDRVLQSVSGLLINQVRASDFVFRYGGEEFLIVLAEVDQEQAEAVAEKIRSRVEAAETLMSDDRSIKVTLSIGIAAFDGHPDYQRLVERADKALYEAKHAGRNRCVMSPG
jgi:diguanylate cyclase